MATLSNDFIKQLQRCDAVPPMAMAADRQTGATFYLVSDPDFLIDDLQPTTEQVVQRVTKFARSVFTEPVVCVSAETRVGEDNASLLVVYRSLSTGERGQFVVRVSRFEREWRLADVKGPANFDWKYPAEDAGAWRTGSANDVRFRLQEVIKACILRSAKIEGLVVPIAVGVDAHSGGVYAAGDALCWTPHPDEILDDAFVLNQARKAIARWPALVVGTVQGGAVKGLE